MLVLISWIMFWSSVRSWMGLVHLKSRKIKLHCPICEKTYSSCIPLTASAFTYRGEMQIEAKTFPAVITQSPIPKASPVLTLPVHPHLKASLTSHPSARCQPVSFLYPVPLDSFICGSRHNIKMGQGCQGTHGHIETSHFGLAIT